MSSIPLNAWTRFAPAQAALWLSLLASLFVSDTVTALNGPSAVARLLSAATDKWVSAAHVEAVVDVALYSAAVLCFVDWALSLLLSGRSYRLSASGNLMDVLAVS
jgi:hypothetical protein